METNNPGKAKQARVSLLASLSWDEIQQRARLEADGAASASIIAQLESDPVRWRNVLTDMIEEAEDTLQSVRRIKGPHRNQIMTDFESEFSLLTEAFERATGDPYLNDDAEEVEEPAIPDGAAVEPIKLQLSWNSGKVVAWASGAFNEADSAEGILARLVEAGAPENAWENYRDIALPTGSTAPALAAHVGNPAMDSPGERTDRR